MGTIKQMVLAALLYCQCQKFNRLPDIIFHIVKYCFVTKLAGEVGVVSLDTEPARLILDFQNQNNTGTICFQCEIDSALPFYKSVRRCLGIVYLCRQYNRSIESMLYFSIGQKMVTPLQIITACVARKQSPFHS